jgi:hypothetical protein
MYPLESYTGDPSGVTERVEVELPELVRVPTAAPAVPVKVRIIGYSDAVAKGSIAVVITVITVATRIIRGRDVLTFIFTAWPRRAEKTCRRSVAQ